MKSFATLFVLTAGLSVAKPALAQVPATVQPKPQSLTIQKWSRIDFNGDQQGYESVGLIVKLPDGSTIEGYGFGISDKRRGSVDELRAGYIHTIKASKGIVFRAGAYLSEFPSNGKWYVLPWADGSFKLPDGLTLKWCIASHQPLNGGRSTLFSNETALTAPVDEAGQLRIGIATAFSRKGDAPICTRIGPKAELKLGKNAQLQLRYLLKRGEGQSAMPEQIRIQLSL